MKKKKRLNVRIDASLYGRIEKVKENHNRDASRWKQWTRTDIVEMVLKGYKTLEELENAEN